MSGLSAEIRCTTTSVNVEVHVPEGEVLAIFGPNGAGKSTLLRSLAGLQRTVRGEIRLSGRTLLSEGRSVPPHQRRVTLLSQSAGLFPHMTVRRNVEFSPGATDVDYWMQAVGITDLARRKPHQISEGQAQRVAIARAMAAQPQLLLLDEPFAAVDVQVTTQLRTLLAQVLAARRQTAILVTHNADDARAMAHSAMVMADGRAVARGSVDEVLAQTDLPFIAALTER